MKQPSYADIDKQARSFLRSLGIENPLREGYLNDEHYRVGVVSYRLMAKRGERKVSVKKIRDLLRSEIAHPPKEFGTTSHIMTWINPKTGRQITLSWSMAEEQNGQVNSGNAHVMIHDPNFRLGRKVNETKLHAAGLVSIY